MKPRARLLVELGLLVGTFLLLVACRAETGKTQAPDSGIRVIASDAISSRTRVYVIECSGTRFVVVEGMGYGGSAVCRVAP